MATPTAASPRGVRSGLCCFWFFGSECGPVGPVLSGYFIPLFFIRGGYSPPLLSATDLDSHGSCGAGGLCGGGVRPAFKAHLLDL